MKIELVYLFKPATINTLLEMIATLRLSIFLLYILLCCTTLTFATSTHTETSPADSAPLIDLANIDKDALSKLTAEEKEWYDKFQNGLLFFDGWQQISSDILACLPPEEKGGARFLLKTIGVKIGTEWSRDNSIRKIDTDQLQSWGKRLKKARKESVTLVADTLKRIASEVDAILVE